MSARPFPEAQLHGPQQGKAARQLLVTRLTSASGACILLLTPDMCVLYNQDSCVMRRPPTHSGSEGGDGLQGQDLHGHGVHARRGAL